MPIVYDYPKTSCWCADCAHEDPQLDNKGHPSNLSAANCDLDPWKCQEMIPTTAGHQPDFKSGITWLNPSAWGDMTAVNEFERITCPHNTPECKVVYASTDPRLYDIPRVQHMTLDRPPLDATVALKDIYTDPSLENYGKTVYNGYDDIKAGQILYYIDKEIAGPFFSPNFENPSLATAGVFQDPMGGMKPQYDRTPLTHQNPINTKTNNYNGLSWIQDSGEHREDMMARQLWRQNQQNWSNRWAWNENNA